MTFEVRTTRLHVLARGTGYGCAAGAVVALLPGLLLSAVSPEYAPVVLVVALAIGMGTGSSAGFAGGLALAHYCVPGPVTAGRARRVAATAMCALATVVALAIAACTALRHKPVSAVALVSGSLLGAVVTGLIAASLAERVAWGRPDIHRWGDQAQPADAENVA